MSRDILSLLEAGNKAQLEKLRENGHKKGFDNLNIEYVYKRLMDEEVELWEELIKQKRNYSAIRRELADIANFCHMGILACDKILNKG